MAVAPLSSLLNIFPAWSVQSVMLFILITAAVGLLIRGIWEPGALQVTHAEIASPGSEQPLRLVLISDLHAEYLRLRSDSLIARIKAAAPDIVIFAGDLTARPAKVAKAINFMRRIRDYNYGKNITFIAVPGNHDTPESMQLLFAAGYTILENKSLIYNHAGTKWQFTGLADRQDNNPQIDIIGKASLEYDISADKRIIIAHNPDTMLDLPRGSALLFLAGHFHGGQIWAPFRLEYKLLRDEKMASMGFTRGLFIWNNIHGYISRGLGCVLIPLRLFSRPEITIIDIGPKTRN